MGEALLTPTRLYVRSCLAAIRETKAVKALAHITGGGFVDNIPRVLPTGLSVALELDRVPVLPVFKWLAATGDVGEQEMLRTFNCGIGMIAVLDPSAAAAASEQFARQRRDRRAAWARWSPATASRASISADVSTCPGRRMSKKRVAVLISGRGSNMTALIEAAKAADYPAEIALVVSNRPEAPGLVRAREEGITTAVVDHKLFGEDREAFERALDAALDAHRIDFVCLAGFMRLLSPWFVQRWSGKMLNIHPALLPQFKGLHTHRRALEAGVKRTAPPCISCTGNGRGTDRGTGIACGARRRYRRHARRARAGDRAPDLPARIAGAGRRPREHRILRRGRGKHAK